MAPQADWIDTRCPAAHVYMRARGRIAAHPTSQCAHATTFRSSAGSGLEASQGQRSGRPRSFLADCSQLQAGSTASYRSAAARRTACRDWSRSPDCLSAIAAHFPVSPRIQALRQISAIGVSTSPCVMMSVFCASENLLAFMRFCYSLKQESTVENSSFKRPSLRDHITQDWPHATLQC